jgi:hypothetical protein
LPQGLLKKIQFNLLLADLAFQLADALARALQIGSPFGARASARPSLCRKMLPTSVPQPLRPAIRSGWECQ